MAREIQIWQGINGHGTEYRGRNRTMKRRKGQYCWLALEGYKVPCSRSRCLRRWTCPWWEVYKQYCKYIGFLHCWSTIVSTWGFQWEPAQQGKSCRSRRQLPLLAPPLLSCCKSPRSWKLCPRPANFQRSDARKVLYGRVTFKGNFNDAFNNLVKWPLSSLGRPLHQLSPHLTKQILDLAL